MIEGYDRVLQSMSVPEELKGKRILLMLDLGDEGGFFSSFPLMEGLRRSGAECYMITSSKGSKVIRMLKSIWEILDGEDEASRRFLSMVNDAFAKKGEGSFARFVSKPDVVLQHRHREYYGNGVKIDVGEAEEWIDGLDKGGIEGACKRMLKEGLNMREDEDFIQLIPTPPIKPRLPKEDYLASYIEAYVLQNTAKSASNEVTTISLNFKPDPNLPIDLHLESMVVFWALEHEKNIEEPIFKAYSELSSEKGLSEVCVPPTVWFGFIGEGYMGKDMFGEVIGYPTPNGKARWQSGFRLIRKHSWYPQSKEDGRDPLLRFAITETIPVETFCRTIDVEYGLLRDRAIKIRDIINGAEEIVVDGRGVDGARTMMTVEIGDRIAKVDDGIVDMKAETNFGNFPAGEVFITPEAVHGVFVADEVIAIDRSYLLESPLIIKLKGNEYEVVDGPRAVLNVIERERRKAWERIEAWEAKGLPKDFVELNKKNFMNIGEFALGLNPNAKVSQYLIEAEKIDRTVHIALGSGYDPDRPTTYHWDSVAGWNQRLSVTAIKDGKEVFVLKDGSWKI